MKTDGRISFKEAGWDEFLIGKQLLVGTAVLITLRNSACTDMKMKFVIDTIYTHRGGVGVHMAVEGMLALTF